MWSVYVLAYVLTSVVTHVLAADCPAKCTCEANAGIRCPLPGGGVYSVERDSKYASLSCGTNNGAILSCDVISRLPRIAARTLTFLKISRCVYEEPLACLPSALGVNAIRELYIESSSTSISLPRNLFDGINIFMLTIKEYRLSDVAGFQWPAELEKLILIRNGIDRLRTGFLSKMNYLTYLDEGNSLSIIETGSLPSSLERLELNGDKRNLTLGPRALSLPRLSVARLINVGLDSLPEDVLAGAVSLKSLYIGNNKLTFLPDKLFRDSSALEWLDIRINSLQRLSRETFKPLQSLLILDLAYNELTTLPNNVFADLMSVRQIVLHDNKLVTVSDNFQNLPSLRTLLLGGNRLETFSVPVTSLNRLQLSNNLLREVEPNWRRNMPKLVMLELSGNRFTQLNSSDLDFLQPRIEVDFSINMIKTVHISPDAPARPARITIANNPYNCDCELLDFVRKVQGIGGGGPEINIRDAVCAEPQELKSRPLSIITSHELLRFCPVSGNGGPNRNSGGAKITPKCVLPSYPNNGQFIVLNAPNAVPGYESDALYVTITCDTGYGLLGKNELLCVSGIWSGKIPQCARLCKLATNTTVDYQCFVEGSSGPTRKCNEYEPSGTFVWPSCKSLYRPSYTLNVMSCKNGVWNYNPNCIPECGTVTPVGEKLIIGGRSAKRGELPWHAGIYSKVFRPYKQICGGSLVSTKAVISAAHCFWSQYRTLEEEADDFAVAVGKLYRPWNNIKDDDAQKSDVSAIRVPDYYQGVSTNFQSDIAIVILATPIVYKQYIRPVCVDFETNFNKRQLTEGNMGKVAGWGLTAENGNASQVLRVVELPVVGFRQCYDASPAGFRAYITNDKICAGFGNGTALCHGDSGGGLSFPQADGTADRFYLRGIVSTAPNNDNLCNAAALTTFTEIKTHEEFIKEHAYL